MGNRVFMAAAGCKWCAEMPHLASCENRPDLASIHRDDASQSNLSYPNSNFAAYRQRGPIRVRAVSKGCEL
jgi:hypothetical protein